MSVEMGFRFYVIPIGLVGLRHQFSFKKGNKVGNYLKVSLFLRLISQPPRGERAQASSLGHRRWCPRVLAGSPGDLPDHKGTAMLATQDPERPELSSQVSSVPG